MQPSAAVFFRCREVIVSEPVGLEGSWQKARFLAASRATVDPARRLACGRQAIWDVFALWLLARPGAGGLTTRRSAGMPAFIRLWPPGPGWVSRRPPYLVPGTASPLPDRFLQLRSQAAPLGNRCAQGAMPAGPRTGDGLDGVDLPEQVDDGRQLRDRDGLPATPPMLAARRGCPLAPAVRRRC